MLDKKSLPIITTTIATIALQCPMGRRLVFVVASTTIIIIIINCLSTVTSLEPDFAEPIPNITVVAGRDASLACVVSNLGTYKVAWIHFDRSTILTVHKHVITRNPRIHVSFNEHRGWILHIKDVRETDRGSYMCQINTEPVKTQVGYVTVVVPPNIIDSETSSEVNAREDTSVVLKCRAKGNPTPTINWSREDGSNIRIAKGKEVSSVSGEVLEIIRVSRLHMGAYLCIASNGIPPAVSKRIVLKVDFHPHLMISHQLVGAPLHYDAILECHIEAHPKSINYWAGKDGLMIFANDKYEILYTEKSYSLDMQLRIKNLEKQDYGEYRCIVKNPLGETDGQITLYKTEAPTANPSLLATFVSSKAEDFTKTINENHSNYHNPSSLRVQDNDKALRYKHSRMKGNKTDDFLLLPKDLPHSSSSVGSCSVKCRGASLAVLLSIVFSFERALLHHVFSLTHILVLLVCKWTDICLNKFRLLDNIVMAND